MNLLDVKYKFLITVFIAGIPVYLGDAIITYNNHEYSWCGLVSSLLMLDMGLIVLFYGLMQRQSPQSNLQIYLTLSNIGAIGFAFSYLINHLPNGL